jgi:Holliday junction resolvasome RuvABC endonuclease subunit
MDALLHRLNFMLSAPEYMPDVIYYEKVMAHRGKNGKTNIYAAHCYGALEGALQYWCLLHGVRLESAGVTEIKKAFGNGSLSKKGMQKSAMILWGIDNISEDEADALGLLWLACKQEGVIK